MFESLQLASAPEVGHISPGEHLPLILTVHNASSIVDRFHLTVGGLPADWYSLDRVEVTLFPGGSEQVALTLHPPGDVTSGDYPITVRATSQSDAAVSVERTISVTIETTGTVRLELLPNTVHGRRGTFRLAVHNQSNAATTVAVEPRDNEDGLHFRLDPPGPVTVTAGGDSTILVHARPRKRVLMGEPHLYEIEIRGTLHGRAEQVRAALLQQALFEYVPRFRSPRLPFWLRRLRAWTLLSLLLLLLLPMMLQGAAVGVSTIIRAQATGTAQKEKTSLRGPQGPAGPRGAPGRQGPQGSPGPKGAPGPYGAGGPAGPRGETGAVGPAGPRGETGAAGPAGPAGPRGKTGATGSRGRRGPEGIRGPAGARGANGRAGLPGPVGPRGPAGPQGAMGPRGPRGSTGERGATGAVGLRGPRGNNGDTGPVGPPGLAGAAGPQGPQGVPGVPGLAGPKGDVGSRGSQGYKGDTGAVGPRGPRGASGPAGPPGPVGAKGDVGNTGPAGLPGSPGPTGAPGPSGPTGPKGDKGDPGAPGPPGPQGSGGPAGPTGPTGPAGPAGPAGVAGVKQVTQTYTITLTNDGTLYTYFATCPDDTSAVSGGYEFSLPTPSASLARVIQVVASRPDPYGPPQVVGSMTNYTDGTTGRAWAVDVYYSSADRPAMHLTVYAICAPTAMYTSQAG